MAELMTTREVADYLRLKERKIYDLVREGRIPCVRVTGRWLFPKAEIDLWLAEALERAGGGGSGGVRGGGERRAEPQHAPAPAPPVIAGSHDPLLEWCVAESGCGLALLPGGSVDGLRKLAERRALACGAHILDAASGEYNAPAIARTLGSAAVVAIEWARREQGLVVARGNPLGIAGLADLRGRRARVVRRQDDAGSQILLRNLLERAGLAAEAELDVLPEPARNEIEVGLAVLDGRADAGLAIRAVARQLRLDFVPLAVERYDLVVGRRDYFEEPFQRLLAFARSEAATARATDLEGYDLGGLGTVRYNGP